MRNIARRPIGDATAQPLVIVAGLPAPNHSAIAKAIRADFPTWKVIATPFPRDPKPPYGDNGALLDLVRTVCDFAEAQTVSHPPRPGQLVLLYVDDANCRKVIDVFGYSTLAIPLIHDSWDWPYGKHWRSDPDAVYQLVQSALHRASVGDLHELKIRLEKDKSDEVLLLPPRNFHLTAGAVLDDRFRDAHLLGAIGDIDDADILNEEFTIESLPTFFKNTGEVRKNFRVDDRGLVFAISKHGQHGPSRMQNVSQTQSLSDFRALLEGLYRFGHPLRSGFQHDVQWPHDKALVSETFVDVNKSVRLSQSHANIYSNDAVR
ncbi:hypothetical protein [Neorhizobium sp. DAR64872/K0K18]|uniref:hypothetical protein n=1 Tax=Neorhizobium sp. DAR64872/K0K18 TaxID=3421958 RepID=UPI003D29152D